MKLGDLACLNNSDRQLLLSLLVLAVIVLFALFMAGDNDSDTTTTPPTGDIQTENKPQPVVPDKASTATQRELFPFDPNTADSIQLLRLGLRPWQIHNINKYRRRGGIYRSKKDFARLYGLTVKEYRELEPYIRISPDYLPASTLFERKPQPDTTEERSIHHPVKISEGATVDLNTCDTTSLKTVPGIGSYFARRIMEYGNRLGGYVSVSQLDEIDNFPSTAKAFFVVSQPHPQRLPLNHLTLNELKRHPYINFYQARAITDFRRLHGPIDSLSQLRLLPEFTPETIDRLRPYISFE
jgi:DNA uptake protein ComE-like DNA-binding protein